jgi:hypothetical protein
LTLSAVVREREIVALLETEGYGLCLKPAAEEMGRSPGSASRWVTKAATSRRTEPSIAARTEQLDAAL